MRAELIAVHKESCLNFLRWNQLPDDVKREFAVKAKKRIAERRAQIEPPSV